MAGLINPVEVENLAQVQSALRAAAAGVQSRAAQVFERSASEVADRARSLVPRGPSGAARASLEAMGASVVAGGARAPYFGWLDWGGLTGIRGTVSRPFIRGGRYLWPTLTANQQAMITALEAGLADEFRAQGLEVT